MFPVGSGRIFVSVKINLIFWTIQWCLDYLHDKTDFDIKRHKSFNIMLNRSDSNVDSWEGMIENREKHWKYYLF